MVINKEPSKIYFNRPKKMITPVRKTNSIKRDISITYGPIETKVVFFSSKFSMMGQYLMVNSRVPLIEKLIHDF